MPRATVLRASTYRRMPWKNGGGETVEIAISPEGAALSEFDWRISMATVATDGPFSIFPGIDRTLSIIKGDGMSLAIAGRPPVLLTQENHPLAFPADVAVSATLASGPITDLNVMTRRAGLRHDVERAEVNDRFKAGIGTLIWLVLCHRGSVSVEWQQESEFLNSGDTLLVEGAVGSDVTLSGKALCYLISIGPA
ncbi:HutD family protein [Rhizobium sp. Root1220]|uniref:HutD/Ves family protein n=1 Tax=Rhizobium sp. Root1220 TaxID=1736432 RepID=UPI0006F771CE|nr:HutD family protein [Rhizobium sp. Root1220]KQV65111.1 HutD-family protein [Rhizobium sp. Root1220]